MQNKDRSNSSNTTSESLPLTANLQQVLRYLQSLGKLTHLHSRHLGTPTKNNCQELQQLWGMLIDGYNAGLETPATRLKSQLQSAGICEGRVLYEGAAAAKASLCLTGKMPWSHLDPFLSEVEPYGLATLGLGVGAAFSHLRLPFSVSRTIELEYWAWMACDSYGFTEGMYNSHATIVAQSPKDVSGLAKHAFHQGVGRSFYFISGGDPRRIIKLIDFFPAENRNDLWNGVGLMTGYWGLLDAKDVRHLLKRTGSSRSAFQQGISIAALLRTEGSAVKDFCEDASRISCGASAQEVAKIAVQAMSAEPILKSAVTYYRWQNSIDSCLRALC